MFRWSHLNGPLCTYRSIQNRETRSQRFRGKWNCRLFHLHCQRTALKARPFFTLTRWKRNAASFLPRRHSCHFCHSCCYADSVQTFVALKILIALLKHDLHVPAVEAGVTWNTFGVTLAILHRLFIPIVDRVKREKEFSPSSFLSPLSWNILLN